MSDLNTYIDRIKNKGDFRSESAMIEKMVSEVTQFVRDIAAADLMVKQMHSIERDLRYGKDLKDEDRQNLERELDEAKKAELMIDKQKSALRALKGPISQLNSAVNKIV